MKLTIQEKIFLSNFSIESLSFLKGITEEELKETKEISKAILSANLFKRAIDGDAKACEMYLRLQGLDLDNNDRLEITRTVI